MFSIFKPKKRLQDLITNEYFDIHSHLLPNIDDGCPDFETTLSLINSMKNIGFSEITTTPHVIKNIWNNTKLDIQNAEQKTILDLKNSNCKIKFKAAAEYMMDIDFENLFKTEPLLTLKDNLVLVEMSYINAPIQLYQIIFDLQIAGYKPVLAHPERYSFYANKTIEYHRLKKAGCLFQLNLLSTVGYYGKDALKTADYLLKNNLIDFVGSDIHHYNHLNSFQNILKIKNTDNLKDCISKNIFFRI